MDYITLLIVALCATAPLVVTQRLTMQVSLAAGITMSILIHAEMAQSTLALTLIVTPLIQIAAWFRSRAVLRLPHTAALLFLLYWCLVNLMHSHTLLSALYSLIAASGLLAMAITARSLGPRALDALLLAAVVCIPILASIAVGEAFFGMDALWPRRDGTTYRHLGDNNLWPGLGVRAMGSTGYSITLGLVAAALTSVVLWKAAKRSSVRWGLLGCIGILIVFLSGTRTALLGLALGLLVSYLWGRRVAWLHVTGGLLIVALLLWQNLELSESFSSSDSVVHRLRITESISALLTRSPEEVVFGSGFASIGDLFDVGLIVGVDGILVLDNAYIGTLIGTGIVGFLFLMLSIVRAMFTGLSATRAMLVLFIVALGSYDVTTWRSLVVLLVVALSTLELSSDGFAAGSKRQNGTLRRRPDKAWTVRE